MIAATLLGVALIAGPVGANSPTPGAQHTIDSTHRVIRQFNTIARKMQTEITRLVRELYGDGWASRVFNGCSNLPTLEYFLEDWKNADLEFTYRTRSELREMNAMHLAIDQRLRWLFDLYRAIDGLHQHIYHLENPLYPRNERYESGETHRTIPRVPAVPHQPPRPGVMGPSGAPKAPHVPPSRPRPGGRY